MSLTNTRPSERRIAPATLDSGSLDTCVIGPIGRIGGGRWPDARPLAAVSAANVAHNT
jgi:hypothetical protein